MLQKIISPLVILILSQIALITPLHALDSQVPWDQNRATELAASLVKNLEKMVNDPMLKKSQSSVLAQRKYEIALTEFKILREDALTLSQQLKAGKTKLYTMAALKRILNLRSNIKMYAEDADIAPSIRNKSNITTEILAELSALYNL